MIIWAYGLLKERTEVKQLFFFSFANINALTGYPSTLLKRGSKKRDSCPISNLRGNASSVSLLNMMLAIGVL